MITTFFHSLKPKILFVGAILSIFFIFPVPANCDWLPHDRVSGLDFIARTTTSNQSALAVDNTGNIHFAWLDSRDNSLAPTFEVYYKELYTTGRWSIEVQMTTAVTRWDPDTQSLVTEYQDKETPGIAVDSSGNIYISYVNKVTRSPWVKTYAPGRSLPPIELAGDCDPGCNPVLAIDSSDTVHIVWKGLADGVSQIFYRNKPAGGDWGSVEQLTDTGSEKRTPMIITDATGTLHLVWVDNQDTPGDCPAPGTAGAPGPFEILYKKKPLSGSWTAATNLSSSPCSTSLEPYITAGPSGDVHVAWKDNRDGNFEIYYLSYSGSWNRPALRLTDAAAASENPHLAVDDLGQIHLTWQDARYYGGTSASRFSLYYKMKHPSHGWGDDYRLSRIGSQGSVVTLGNKVHVAYSAPYMSFASGNPQVYHMEYDPEWTTPTVPTEVMMVLDISGSMNSPADGITPYSRLDRAKWALTNFLDRFNLRNPTGAYFGLVTFPDRMGICPSAETVISLSPLTDRERLQAITHTIPGLTADGQTPLLAGMNRARDLLAASSSTSGKMILLVSDGRHNCPDTSLPRGFPGDSFPPVYTVGIGTAVELDHTSMSLIAAATGGEFVDTTSEVPIDWVKTIIQSALGLEAECDPAGKLVAGRTNTHKIRITERDKDIAFEVSWSAPRQNCIDLTITTPGGKKIRDRDASKYKGINVISRDTYKILYLDDRFLSTIKQGGIWFMDVSPGPSFPVQETLPYRYSVLLDSSVKMLPHFDRQIYAPGDPIKLEVQIVEGKRPLVANYRVHVHAPLQSKEDRLATKPIKKSAAMNIKKMTVSGDPLSAPALYDRMLTKTLKKPFRVENRTTMLPFYDDGTNGDRVAGDGIYTLIFKQTWVPGTYTFDITAQGKTAAGDLFRRQKIMQRHIIVKTVKSIIK